MKEVWVSAASDKRDGSKGAIQESGEALARRALDVGRREGWLAAEPLWDVLFEGMQSGEIPPIDTRRVLAPLAEQSSLFAVAEPEKLATSSPPLRGRYCIYTALFGNFDRLRPISYKPRLLDFICFTDQDIEVDGWEIRKRPSAADSYLRAKHYKVFPHIHLGEYDASLFVDANTIFCGDVYRFIARWCDQQAFMMWRHWLRCDAYDEAEAVLVLGKHKPGAVLRQIAEYEKAGLPRATGLVEAGFIWRRHHDPVMQQLMKRWWAEITSHSRRDQISLCYLMWRDGVRPVVFPREIGNFRRNPITFVPPHAPRRPIEAGSAARGAATMRERHIVFLEPPQSSERATLSRSQKLFRLLPPRVRTGLSLKVSSDLSVRDSIVVLTSDLLAQISLEEVETLKRRNIAILADFAHRTLRKALLPAIDLLLAPSIGAYREATVRHPKILCALVTEPVDERIPAMTAPQDRFAPALVAKGVLTDEEITASVPWGKKTECNFHYAIRPAGKNRKNAPFLDGFTAARCGANIAAGSENGDAVFYLGDDYPYLLGEPTLDAAKQLLAFAAASFGGPEWRYGLEVMAQVRERSSADQVAKEFQAALTLIE
jgi:hypothetical protein